MRHAWVLALGLGCASAPPRSTLVRPPTIPPPVAEGPTLGSADASLSPFEIPVADAQRGFVVGAPLGAGTWLPLAAIATAPFDAEHPYLSDYLGLAVAGPEDIFDAAAAIAYLARAAGLGSPTAPSALLLPDGTVIGAASVEAFPLAFQRVTKRSLPAAAPLRESEMDLSADEVALLRAETSLLRAALQAVWPELLEAHASILADTGGAQAITDAVKLVKAAGNAAPVPAHHMVAMSFSSVRRAAAVHAFPAPNARERPGQSAATSPDELLVALSPALPPLRVIQAEGPPLSDDLRVRATRWVAAWNQAESRLFQRLGVTRDEATDRVTGVGDLGFASRVVFALGDSARRHAQRARAVTGKVPFLARYHYRLAINLDGDAAEDKVRALSALMLSIQSSQLAVAHARGASPLTPPAATASRSGPESR